MLRDRSTARRAGVVAVLVFLAAVPGRASACDVCAVYTATELREGRTGFRLGVSEQLSRFTTLQRGGEEVPNPAGERLTSAITQVWLGYNFTQRLGLQLNLPLISRTFRRVEGGRPADGDETGVGDLALVGQALPYSLVTERSVFRFSVLGGVKFPTGDSGRLAEELAEPHHAAASVASIEPQHAGHHDGPHEAPQSTGLVSGIHGHDLALGSGSFDGIVGTQLFWSWQRLFATAGGQYAIRTEGDFQYQYANDLTWSAGPGVFALLTPTYTFAVQALTTGETKGNDEQAGVQTTDTAVTALYAGPALAFTWGTSLAVDVAADLPVIQHNTGLQIVPDFRIRGGASWRF
jgi:hypothetical protein